jgi:hypothetical protein
MSGWRTMLCALHVVRLADQLVDSKAGDLDEDRVDVDKAAFGIGFGNDGPAILDEVFDAGTRQVGAQRDSKISLKQHLLRGLYRAATIGFLDLDQKRWKEVCSTEKTAPRRWVS